MTNVTLQPGPDGQDVWITNVFYNFGVDDGYLKVGGWSDLYYSLLKFDLSGASLPASVTSATLQLYSIPFGDYLPTPMYFDQLQTAWDDNYHWYDYALSYTNIGTVGTPGTGWIDIDITAAVNSWLADPSSNDGIQLRPFGNNHNLDYFISSEAIGDLAQFRPELILTFANQPPTVSSIKATIVNGLKEITVGNVVTIELDTSTAVNVVGIPTLQLSNNELAKYVSGTGSNSLIFSYAVQQGDDTSDLQITGLNLPNGASVQDGTGQNIDGPVAQDLAIKIDTTDPIVTVVSASPSSGDLNAGNVITITLSSSGPVKVKGAPTLSLNDGGTANYKAAASNLAAGILVFNYTVKATENALNLGIANVNTDSVGASVKDAAGHVADFTNALTTFNGLQIDTVAPTIASVAASGAGIDNGNGYLGLGSIVTLTVNFSESVKVATTGGIPTLNLNDGGKAIYAGGSGTNALNFTYSVAAKQTTPDLMVNGLALNGGTIIDGAGNNAVLSGAKINPFGILQIDGNVPVVKEHLTNDTGISHSDSITANAAIAGTGDPNTIIQLIIDGTANAATVLVNSLGQWFFTPAFADGLHTVVATEIDAAGNTGATSPLTLTQDTKAPTVVSVTDDANSGGLSIGDTLSIKVQFGEAVNVAGNPILTLNDGGKATYDAVKSFPLFGQSVFDYTVSAHEDTANLQVVKLAGGSIKDIAGNSADLSGATSVSLGIATGANSLPPSNSLATDITLAENKIYSQVADQFPFDTNASQAEHLTDLTDLKFVLPILKDLDSAQGFTFSDQHPGYIYETGHPNFDTGQCVQLVFAIDHYLPLGAASNWGAGDIAVDLNNSFNPAMLPGTPIATFGADGHYNNDHAGIFLGYGTETWKDGSTQNGFFMLDQYITPHPGQQPEPAEIRFHPFDDAALKYHNIVAFADLHLV